MIHTIQGIVEAAKGGQGGIIAVAAAHDEPVIEAVVAAKKEGIATPILVGHADEIRAMLSGLPPRLWPCAPKARRISS